MYIDGTMVKCNSCSVQCNILCPYCNIGQLNQVDENSFECSQCNQTTSMESLVYILSNNLKVHESKRCHYCNGPTLAREELNISARCFEFPNCGNQENLFMSENQHVLIFFDLETTGLEAGSESIIEIGACKVDQGGKEYFFKEFIKPVNNVSSLITKITGINNEMLVGAPALKPVLESFLDFCGEGACLVAHNAQFDIPWLLSALLRHDMKSNFKQALCTLNWAKQQEEGKRSLGALSKKYNIGHENAHRALADAVVTKQLYFI